MRTEVLGAMEKAKVSSLTASIKKAKPGKSKSKLARNGKASQKLVKNSLNTAEKSGGLLRVQQPQPLGRLGRILEAHIRKT